MLLLRQTGYFAHTGSDEDFALFCKQVEVNAQSNQADKEERRRQWILNHSEKHQQQELARAMNRGRGRGPRGLRGGRSNRMNPRNNQQGYYNQQGNNHYGPQPNATPYSYPNLQSNLNTPTINGNLRPNSGVTITEIPDGVPVINTPN